MAALPFLDLKTIDLTHTLADQEAIYQRLPQRFEFMQLDRVIHIDMEKKLAVAVREVRPDEFWVRGHIPGRPLLPGVLMLEGAAQFAAYLARAVRDDDIFMGFGGVDAAKFRVAVIPPATMYYILKLVETRSRRVIVDAQGVVNDQLVFEARITGMVV